MLTRSQRRVISRDEARANPVAPKRPQDGTVGRWANRPLPRKRVLMGTDAQLAQAWRAPASTRAASLHSGQARVNAKRNARAEFWRTIPIRIWALYDDATQKRLLTLFPRGSRIHGCTPVENSRAYVLDMHIPGMPAEAVRGNAVFYPTLPTGDYFLPRLDRIDYFDADGQIIDAETELAVGAAS